MTAVCNEDESSASAQHRHQTYQRKTSGIRGWNANVFPCRPPSNSTSTRYSAPSRTRRRPVSFATLNSGEKLLRHGAIISIRDTSETPTACFGAGRWRAGELSGRWADGRRNNIGSVKTLAFVATWKLNGAG